MRFRALQSATVAAALLMPSQAAMADTPTPVTLNLSVIGAEGTVRVNGVPFNYFRQGGPKVSKTDHGTFTDTSPVNFISTGYLLLCMNGDNKLAVEARITDPKGEVHVTLVKSLDEPPLFDQTLKQSGTLNYTLPQSGLPEWTWIKADTVTDGKDELLKAVAAYQQAFVKKDTAAIHAFERSYFDNVQKMQPMPPETLQEALKGEANDIRSAKLRQLPAPSDLLVESHLDGRLYMVTDKNHQAPVLLESPGMSDHPWGMGEYWSRTGGKWSVVKRPD